MLKKKSFYGQIQTGFEILIWAYWDTFYYVII